MNERKGWDNAFTAEGLHGTVEGSPSYAGALSFMRRKYTRDLKGVDVAVTGIPLDLATTNRPGARFGPRAIRAVTPGISWARPWPWDFDPFDRLAVVDYGDCEFDYGEPEAIVPFIEQHIAGILEGGAASLVLGTRLALLEQPEFHDPQRIRDLYEAVETKERLLDVLDHVLEGGGVCVALGGEVEDPALRDCALVACHYGDNEGPMGALGVIGPSRMDYGRVIPLVDYFSHVVTEKLNA